MTNLAIGLWCSLGLLGLIALRIPIAIAMIFIASLGIWLVQGEFATWFQLSGAPVNNTSYGLSVIPLFILMGNLASHAGLSRDLFTLASRLTKRIRGGLALSTILACAGFSTLSGSSLATAATIGRISISEMLERGYSKSLASGTVAAGGVIGILIPPSVMFVVYGLLTEQSIRKLFAAGLLPGVLLTTLFMLTALIWAWLSPKSVQADAKILEKQKENQPLQPVALRGVLSLCALVVVVLGGLYSGFFTATESAAVGTVGTLLIAIFNSGLNLKKLADALIETSSTSAMIFLIVIASSLYASFLSVTGISGWLTAFVLSIDASPLIILVVILLIYLVLGCFMDSLGMVLLTIPVFYPVVLKLGIDPIYFGVLVVMVVEMGLITPPLGMNIFVVRSVAPSIPLQTIFKGASIYLFAFLVAVACVLLFPSISLWLPELMHGS